MRAPEKREPKFATTVHDVLDFWFGPPDSAERGTRRDVWFRKSDAFDKSVRDSFLPLYQRALAGRLAGWNEAPHSLLALIIVFDQLPRNMFRNDARAFATDGRALSAAQQMVACGWDRQLAPVARCFVYLPFEHAEDPAMQERALELFGGLSNEPVVGDMPEWARKHHAVIARFGRFPHRNAILGRASTPEEIEFLAQPGSSF
jgi:uncharacterized protein (DUF924 family)